MDVKTLIVKAETDLFERRVKEYLEQGYKLLQSNITTIGADFSAPFFYKRRGTPKSSSFFVIKNYSTAGSLSIALFAPLRPRTTPMPFW